MANTVTRLLARDWQRKARWANELLRQWYANPTADYLPQFNGQSREMLTLNIKRLQVALMYRREANRLLDDNGSALRIAAMALEADKLVAETGYTGYTGCQGANNDNRIE